MVAIWVRPFGHTNGGATTNDSCLRERFTWHFPGDILHDAVDNEFAKAARTKCTGRPLKTAKLDGNGDTRAQCDYVMVEKSNRRSVTKANNQYAALPSATPCATKHTEYLA